MHAMQYEITLPADYDMEIIRRRVATTGSMLDDFPGLGIKAYCMRERGVAGSSVNQYAPFYLWRSVEGMNRFLLDNSGYNRIIDFVGRTVVQHWVGVGFERGPAHSATPRTATRLIEPIPAEVDPAAAVAVALESLRKRANDSAVHSTALAIDPRTWELVHFTLWADKADTGYQVLYACSPELAGLKSGRHW